MNAASAQSKARYLPIVWTIVESGAVYTSAALVQLVTYLLHMNAGVILELMLAQLSVSLLVPLFSSHASISSPDLILSFRFPFAGDDTDGDHRARRDGIGARWSGDGDEGREHVPV